MTNAIQTTPKPIIHADDFGISLAQSYKILECSSACGGSGPLSSTSILVGSAHARECAELIKPFVDAGKMRIGLHLNLVEGQSCAAAESVPDLVDKNGMFCLSFTQLLSRGKSVRKCEKGAAKNKKTLHTSKCRPTFYEQLYTEIRAQLDKYFELFPRERCGLRIDTHQHTIMIPAVMQATFDAIKNSGAALEYMRIPTEPLTPYASTLSNWKNYPPVNFVKNGLLNSLWKPCKKIIEANDSLIASTESASDPASATNATLTASVASATSAADFLSKYSATFYGLVLSGHMEYACTPKMFKKFERAAQAKGTQRFEVLFHPGGCASASECLNPAASDFVTFYLSSHRAAEATALQNFALNY